MATKTRSTSVKSTDGKTISLWQETVHPFDYPPLSKSTSTQVCVVGAGIAGLTTAYLLLKEGKSVIVLDDSAIGDGQTGRTSAHLASALDDRFVSVAKMHGKEAARLCFESHSNAIDLIESIVRDEAIDCDFARLDGYLFRAPTDKPGILDAEFDAAKSIGVAVEKVERLPLSGFDSGPALQFKRQGRFHPQKYLKGLCAAIDRLGGTIHCKTRVTDVQGGDAAKGESCAVTTSRKMKVTAEAVVVATNTPAPINDWAGIYTKQASYRTYVVGLAVTKGTVPDALYWDTLDPYHYVRIANLDEEQDVLLVGGADHKVGQHGGHEKPFDDLEGWARQHFPEAGEVLYRWSGQVQEPEDAMAYIGQAPTAKPNVFAITGDSGMGLTHASLGAMLIRDLILNRPNPWAEIYSPTRKATAAPVDYALENLNAAATLVDYVTPGEVSSENEVQSGQGALIRSGLKKVAVYKDDRGTVHRMSAICTHLGCVVHWNPIEKSWDCPCHGSRFAPTGAVIMGPAISGLSKEAKK